MSEEFKVGDWIETTRGYVLFRIVGFYDGDILATNENGHERVLSPEECKKFTPPPVQGGHMAGYGVEKPKVVQFSTETKHSFPMVLYSNGLLFADRGNAWSEITLPHEQEDLKHLFE